MGVVSDNQVETVCRIFWDNYQKDCWDLPLGRPGAVGPATKESWRKTIRLIIEIFEADKGTKNAE